MNRGNKKEHSQQSKQHRLSNGAAVVVFLPPPERRDNFEMQRILQTVYTLTPIIFNGGELYTGAYLANRSSTTRRRRRRSQEFRRPLMRQKRELVNGRDDLLRAFQDAGLELLL